MTAPFHPHRTPDHDWVAGRRRATLPPARLRAIPLLGVAVGVAASLGVRHLAPQFLDAASWSGALAGGALVGAALGVVAYQVVAHRWSRREDVAAPNGSRGDA